MHLLLLLITLLATTESFELFNLQFLSQKNGAACLDGSAPGIYLYQPDPDLQPVNKSKILIHFEGIDFGWCV
jgi:hypothetical protein